MGWLMEELGLIPAESKRFFFFISVVSRLAVGPVQLPMHWVLGAISLGVKWQGHEADHSAPI
jgi:hypothetical protein